MFHYFILSLIALSIASCTQQEKQLSIDETLLGTWVNTADGRESGDDPFSYQQLKEVYEQDGTYRATGLVELRDVVTGQPVVSITGPDQGNWAIRDGRLEVTLTSSEIESFHSTMLGFTRAAFEDILASTLNTPDVYEVESTEHDEVILRDEDGLIYTLTRVP